MIARILPLTPWVESGRSPAPPLRSPAFHNFSQEVAPAGCLRGLRVLSAPTVSCAVCSPFCTDSLNQHRKRRKIGWRAGNSAQTWYVTLLGVTHPACGRVCSRARNLGLQVGTCPGTTRARHLTLRTAWGFAPHPTNAVRWIKHRRPSPPASQLTLGPWPRDG